MSRTPKAVQELSPGACRNLGSVSLWSNEEARSAEKIIAWPVRPRETSPYRSSAEGVVDFENRPSQRDGVPNGSGLGQFADIARDNRAKKFRRAFSATRLYFAFPGPNSPGYNLFCASRLFLSDRGRILVKKQELEPA